MSRMPLLAVFLVLGAGTRIAAAAPDTTGLDVTTAARFANLALKCLHSEYPNHISHTLDSDAAAQPPHLLTPAFYGCLDWHSDVHGHWLLVRLLRLYPHAPFAAAARAEIARSMTAQNIAGELKYMQQADRASFERPYGLAWLLQLCAELREWQDPQGQQWLATLQPLESEAARRLMSWLPKLHYPIRVGEHDQTAFSFGLIWDWAGVSGNTQMRQLLRDAAQRFYIAGSQLPAELRTFGRGFPLALSRRGRFHAAGARSKGLRCIGFRHSCRESRRALQPPGSSLAWSRTAPIRSLPTSTVST